MLIYLFLFILGSVIGSFLNVCIYRIPMGEQIITGRSKCPHCGHIIKWYDNIPLLSYLILRARCRYCNERISFKYPVVEAITGIYLCLVWRYFNSDIWLSLIYFLYGAFLIIGSFIDIDFMIIPDRITIGGIAIGLIVSTVYPQLFHQDIFWKGFLESFISVLISGGVLYGIAVAGSIIFRKEAMGMGDVKLLGMMGSFLGWQRAVGSIFVASFIGAIVGVIIHIFFRKEKLREVKIPFGPYLSLGSVILLFWGEDLLRWYLGLFYSYGI